MAAFEMAPSSVGPAMVEKTQPPSFRGNIVDADWPACDICCQPDKASREQGPRIALLTPYSGNNLGDAAIQDAIITNIRLRVPGAQFSGISLNCDNFVKRHGIGAFPLCGTNRPFHGMPRGREADQSGNGECSTRSSRKGLSAAEAIKAIKRVPLLGWCLRAIYAWGRGVSQEVRHCVEGFRFLRRQDLLIVSGGGQLDDEWGGPWGHPFTLFKWAILARIAQIPYAIAGVGVCKVTSTTSRLFLFATLRMARYRSYRDKNSREFAAGLLKRAARDCVVPDLALSLPSSELPPPAGLRSIAQGRSIVAISPMAYAKPGSWPHENPNLYDRYLHEMARVISQLLKRGHFVVIVWSALSDRIVIPELLKYLDRESLGRLTDQFHVPQLETWKDLVALLQGVDLLVASRLHSVILGFVTQTPTVAISFDPKVDWVMNDLGQANYRLDIRDFAAEDVIAGLDGLTLRRSIVTKQIREYCNQVLEVAAQQYDVLARLAIAGLYRRP